MSRPLDTRIDRVEGRRMAAGAELGSAAIRPTLHAEAAMGAVIRRALARAGVDAAGATRLSFANAAAVPPVAIRTQPNCRAKTRMAPHPPTPITALGRTILSPRSWRWRGVLPAGSGPISPIPHSPNCSPGRSPNRRPNNPAVSECLTRNEASDLERLSSPPRKSV